MNTQQTTSEPLPACDGSVSDTPRTDAAKVVRYVPFGQVGSQAQDMVHASFARQLEREIAEWKQHFIPFAIVHAGKYGEEHHGPNCLHFTHYDLLEKAGARLVDFTRCGDSQNAAVRHAAPASDTTKEP